MLTNVLKAFRLLLVLTILTGVIYPLGITMAGRLFFPKAANGSLVEKNGRAVGSVLIAQKFESPRYFHPRPSAGDFATVPSSAGNQGPTSRALDKLVRERAGLLRADNALPAGAALPADMLFASGSGLDPHISPEAMVFQMERVAAARGFTPDERARFEKIAAGFIEPPQFGLLGEPRVNVLLLNLAIDGL